MRKVMAVSGMFVLLCGLSGCGKGGHEGVMDEQFSLMNEYITVMDGVKDEDSAKAAKPKLEALQARAKDLKKKGEALPKPSEEEQKKLAAKYMPKVIELMPKVMAAQAKQMQYPAIKGINVDPK